MEFTEIREIVSQNLLKEAKITRLDGVHIVGILTGFSGGFVLGLAQPVWDHLNLYTSEGASYLPTQDIQEIEIL